MYYGSYFSYTNKEITTPNLYKVCFSEFITNYKFDGVKKKYLHIWMDVLSDFSMNEIDLYFKDFKKYLKFDYKVVQLDETIDYSRDSTLPKVLEKDKDLLLFTIDVINSSLGECKIMYYFSRMLHESDFTINICRTTIDLKKQLPKEDIFKLILFSYASDTSKSFSHRHHTPIFVNGAYPNNFKTLKEFLSECVKDGYFDEQYIKKIPIPKEIEKLERPKFIEKLIEIYKKI
ncbi:MAG: hypothetical protein ACOC1K_04080 [Nanoarchaeota archaeon]